MELIGLKVKHTVFGVGEIKACGGNCITVEFPAKTSKFIYPDAFEKFIKAEDAEVQSAIIKEINDTKAAAEQKRLAEEAARKAAEEHKAAEDAARRAEIVKKTAYKPKPVERAQREDGHRLTFFVFQGNTFERECNGGYLWAPITDKSGSRPHHWERMLDVRKGDIILHGCNAHVYAISVARGPCYDSQMPPELAVEDMWDREGRRIDCDYIKIENPIKTSHYADDIIRLSKVKYSPFDKDGNGNTGYLYEINRELARIFVKASVDRNQYLGAVDYIDELLSENENA